MSGEEATSSRWASLHTEEVHSEDILYILTPQTRADVSGTKKALLSTIGRFASASRCCNYCSAMRQRWAQIKIAKLWRATETSPRPCSSMRKNRTRSRRVCTTF